MGRPAPGRYPAPPLVEPEACPIATSLQFLGRRWTLTILRDIAFFPKAGFALVRKRNPGLTPRILSIRLRELGRQDFIRKVTPADDPRHPYYELTAKGLEVWPILSALYQFGTRHHAEQIFADGRPRDLAEIYPNDSALLLGPLAEYARAAGAFGSAPGARAEAARGSSRRG